MSRKDFDKITAQFPEPEPGWWKKAWRASQRGTANFSKWLLREAKKFWERGGRQLAMLGLFALLAALMFPTMAAGVLAEIVPVLLSVIIYRAFQTS